MNGSYALDGFFDEMFAAPGEVRPHYAALREQLAHMTIDAFDERRRQADVSFLHQGITFTVYHEEQGIERVFPFDLVPREPRPTCSGAGPRPGRTSRRPTARRRTSAPAATRGRRAPS